MRRDWGREFETMLQQHGRGRGWEGHGGPGDDDWAGPWGSGAWGQSSRRGGRGGRGGPPPWLAGLFGMAQQERARGPRVRRGDVRVAILAVLADGPLNGYQVIGEIADRTDGEWRPSPGSVYPTMSQLEDEGLVEGDDERGRRPLRLTEQGRTYLEEHADEVAEVWAPFSRDREGGAGRGEDPRRDGPDFASLKPELGRVMNAVWQIISTGTDEQRRAAIGVLMDARRALYGILADHPGEVDDLGDRPESEEER
ncbi:MAG TPA: PadR family transcriptional regulator [Nocardioides sp.]|uniref:PadR family transcriptional regulator n=1 Tax=Nocardioides sp. TaxID=35761 RepID=UPI002E36FA04|nr:PadR family transcriptional regulator [Nocardioides sp.]HEX3930276.1 PadR family transcriptional regulator [Nocardioides sp.]